MGIIAYGFHLFKQMWIIADSKYVILDGYCFTVSALTKRKNQTVIQMWHAMGALKRFGFSIVGEPEGRSREIATYLKMHRGYDYYVVSSAACDPYFREAYGYIKGKPNSQENAKPLIANLPRTKYIYKLQEETKQGAVELNGRRIALFVPTFRKNFNINPYISELQKAFSEASYDFLVKPHPLMEIEASLLSYSRENDSTFDLMKRADLIILDYSAAIYEAVLFDKEIVFFAPDFAEYINNRAFYIDYEREMPGKICKNIDEMMEYLALSPKEKNQMTEKREKFKQKWLSGDADIIFKEFQKIIK